MSDADFDGTLAKVASLLGSAQRVLFVTGAGVSADSGLPTYRGIGGLYDDQSTEEGISIEEALSGRTFRSRPELTWKYLLRLERTCRDAHYNNAHRIIAQLGNEKEKVVVLTQNVDGLHRAAGSKVVIDIHGDMHELLCTRCDKRWRVQSYAGLAEVPKCGVCLGVVRPDVVLFGENLPAQKMDALIKELGQGFDLVVSVGTSGLFPYIRLPMIRAQVYGWPSVDINPLRNAMTEYAQLHLPLGAAQACTAIRRRMTARA